MGITFPILLANLFITIYIYLDKLFMYMGSNTCKFNTVYIQFSCEIVIRVGDFSQLILHFIGQRVVG